MKKFKLIVISSLLIATGITTFAERANNKKIEKKSGVFTEATKEKCMSLKNSKIYQTEITSTEWKEEGPLEEDENARFSGSSTAKASAPAHCVVRGEIEKRKGADGKDYSIGFELRLPEKWNNKFLFQSEGQF